MNNNILNETFKRHLELLNEKLNLRKLMGGDDDDDTYLDRSNLDSSSPYLKMIIYLNGEEAEVDFEIVESDTEFFIGQSLIKVEKKIEIEVVVNNVTVDGKLRTDLFKVAEEWAKKPENLKKIIRALNQKRHQKPS